MDSEIIAAFITGGLAFIGLFVTGYFGIRKINKETYSKRVIEERTKWLLKFRELWGDFMSAWEAKSTSVNNFYNPKFDKDKYNDLMIRGENARYQLISMLNTNTVSNNECNFLLKYYLEKMNLIKKISVKDMKLIDSEKSNILNCCNRVLEKVWQRAKKESKEYEG